MNEVMIFNNPEFGQVRTVTIDGEPWFVANDVAKALGYTNPSKATNDHCKRSQMIWDNDSLGRQQQFKIIPVGDVYRLAARSQLPGAEKFESWIFDEVVPSVLQTGSYNATTEQIPYSAYMEAAKVVRGCKDREERNIIVGILQNGGFNIPVVDVISVDTNRIDKVEFSEDFKKFMNDNGYSYRKFSEVSGLSKSTIHNYATGKTIADEKNMGILKQHGFKQHGVEVIVDDSIPQTISRTEWLDLVKKTMLCKGMNQTDLATELNVSRAYISAIFKGKNAGIGMIPKINEYLGVDVCVEDTSKPKCERVSDEWVKKVRHALIDLDINVGDLAIEVGCSSSTMYGLFSGSRPSVELQHKVNEYLGIE